ncbi:MAG: hypothetical protein MUD08_19550 [Cytophagales bacterium]|nr:hypothetical protein [Cytophagales bacterium]
MLSLAIGWPRLVIGRAGAKTSGTKQARIGSRTMAFGSYLRLCFAQVSRQGGMTVTIGSAET